MNPSIERLVKKVIVPGTADPMPNLTSCAISLETPLNNRGLQPTDVRIHNDVTAIATHDMAYAVNAPIKPR
jgi:hypothetical protein